MDQLPPGSRSVVGFASIWRQQGNARMHATVLRSSGCGVFNILVSLPFILSLLSRLLIFSSSLYTCPAPEPSLLCSGSCFPWHLIPLGCLWFTSWVSPCSLPPWYSRPVPVPLLFVFWSLRLAHTNPPGPRRKHQPPRAPHFWTTFLTLSPFSPTFFPAMMDTLLTPHLQGK